MFEKALLANGRVSTVDLQCQKRLLNQLCHKHGPTISYLGRLMEPIMWSHQT